MKVWKTRIGIAILGVMACIFAFGAYYLHRPDGNFTPRIAKPQIAEPLMSGVDENLPALKEANAGGDSSEAGESSATSAADPTSVPPSVEAATIFILELAPGLAGLFPVEDNPQINSPEEMGREIIASASGISRKLTLLDLLPRDIECEGDGVLRGVLESGDTLAQILEETSGGAPHYVRAAEKVFPIKSFRAGQPYVVVNDPVSGAIQRFEYEINESKKLIIEGGKTPRAWLETIEYKVILTPVAGEIKDNLFNAMADIGENPQLALQLVKLFGSEINFIKDLQPGDKFSALVEKRYLNDSGKGYGRILAATFINRGKLYEAFLFNSGGKGEYYNAKGENLHKTLLQSPLSVTRVTSRFTNNRRHPILGYSRPHHGVDYGAPTGTPVKAVGDGTVTGRGWAGGYGNQVRIKHGSGLESMYSHLSGFARGLRNGQKVRQGQVIGFVGSTGLSTGPHLDFRLIQNGKFINPAKAINPRGAPVAAARLGDFRRTRDIEKKYLTEGKIIEDYTLDSIVPFVVPLIAEKKTHVAAKAQPVKIKKAGRRMAVKKIAVKKVKKAKKRAASRKR